MEKLLETGTVMKQRHAHYGVMVKYNAIEHNRQLDEVSGVYITNKRERNLSSKILPLIPDKIALWS